MTTDPEVLAVAEWQWLADQLRAWPLKRVHPERTMSIATLHDLAANVIDQARLAAEQSIASEVGREALPVVAKYLKRLDAVSAATNIREVFMLGRESARELRDAILALSPTKPAADAEKLVEAAEGALGLLPKPCNDWDGSESATVYRRLKAALSSFQAGGSGRG